MTVPVAVERERERERESMDEVLSASCCGSEMEKFGIGISFPDPCKSGSLSDLESAPSYKTFFILELENLGSVWLWGEKNFTLL